MRAAHAALLPLLLLLCLPHAVSAQLADRKVLTLDGARQVAAAAEATARQNGWNVVIAIVDEGGHLVLLHRLDGTQIGSVEVAQAKARSAALFRRPTKVMADALAQGSSAFLALPGAMPVEGGVPLVADGGVVVGAIGVSGVTSQQDGVVAQAGAAALTGGRND